MGEGHEGRSEGLRVQEEEGERLVDKEGYEGEEEEEC